MAKRKKTTRRRSSDPYAELRKFFEKSVRNGMPFPDDTMFASERKNVAPMPKTGEEWLHEWEEVLQVFANEHDDDLFPKVEKLKQDFQIRDLQQKGSVKATCSIGSKKQQLKLEFNPSKLTYDCTCNCKAKRFCVHTLGLVQFLFEQLQKPTSEVYQIIVGPEFAEKQRKLKQQKILNLLTNAGKNTPEHQTISVEDDQTEVAERICWNLTCVFNFGELVFELTPVIQKEMKRGGWTKGREIKLATFLDMPPRKLSPLDMRIAEAIEEEGYYRYSTPKVNFDTVFRNLAGTNVFQLNREPAELKVTDLEFILLEEEEGYRLTTNASAMAAEISSNESLFTFSGGAVAIDREDCLVTFIPGSRSAVELINSLQKDAVTFKKDEKAELFEQLKPLQQAYSVRLPEGLVDEERALDLQLTLLLQMQKAGHLDATICFTKPDGSLVLPGSGLSRETVDEDGKTIQLLRDLPRELENARQFGRTLGESRYLELSDHKFRIEDQEEIFEFLTLVGDLVGQDEVKVVWHKSSASRFDVLGKLTANNVRVDVKKKRDWFGLEGSCRIGSHDIDLKDLLSGLRGQSKNGLIEIQPGKWAMITEELRKSLQRLSDVSIESRGSLRLDDSAAMTVAALEDSRIQVEADKSWQKALKRVRKAVDINPDPPAALDCDLREYQVDGFRWMCRLAEWGVGGILADEMGLGKTVQTLAMLLQRYESGPALVIAPTSLGYNWQAEAERFAPSLNPILFRESDRGELIANATEGDVIICSYGLALREAELLQSIRWGTLVLDEAQNIKNSNSKTAKAIRKLNADWKVALTGTPVENHLGELWSIFQSTAPGVLGGWEQFRKRFAAPIEKNQDNERRDALANVISPFVLRRTKRAVLKDLPEKNEANLFVELSTEERKRYDQMRLAAIGELDELSTEDFSQDQRFKVLQLLTRLRQLSCHVGLADDTWSGSSAKLDLLMEKLDELKENGNRPLIFSQFTSHLRLIREACESKGISFQYLDGQTTPKARRDRVEKFQNGEGDVFLISLKAGGTGLNLTAADYVIHMDPWWNPAVEDQATDRAHRIGQTNNVMVYRIIAKGTIEEQIIKLHEDKRDLVEGVLAGSEAAAKLSTEQLAEMIRWGGELPTKNSSK